MVDRLRPADDGQAIEFWEFGPYMVKGSLI